MSTTPADTRSSAASAAPKKRRRWLKILVVLAILAVLTVIGLRLSIEPILRRKVIPQFEAKYGIEIVLGELKMGLLDGSADIAALTVSQKGETLLETGRIKVKLHVMDLLSDQVVLEHCRIESPKVKVEVESDGRTNFQRIFQPPVPSTEPLPLILFDDVVIADAVVDVHGGEDTAFKGYTFHLYDGQFRAFDLQISGTPRHSYPGDLRVHFLLDQPEAPAQFDLVAWTSTFDRDPTFQAYAAMTGMDIRSVPKMGFVNRSVLGGTVLTIVGEAQCEDGIIGNGQVVLGVAESGNSFPLRFAGPLKAPIVDRHSAMLSAVNMTFVRLGDVALNSSLSVITGTAGGVFDVTKNLAGTVLDVGSSAVSTVGNLATGDVSGAGGSVKEGVGGLFNRAKNAVGSAVNVVTTGSMSDTPENAGMSADRKALWARLDALHIARVTAFLERRVATVAKETPFRAARFEQELTVYKAAASTAKATGSDVAPTLEK